MAARKGGSSNRSRKFRATIVAAGKSATGIEVPAQVVEALGSGSKPAVRATIKGHTFRTSIGSTGGKFILPVSPELREKAGVAAGDLVDVDMELDTEESVVTVPPDFAKALAADPVAQRRFDTLAYSHRLRHVLAIEEAKTPETRERRIVKAVAMLRSGS
jgi:hypothetical protein